LCSSATVVRSERDARSLVEIPAHRLKVAKRLPLTDMGKLREPIHHA